MERGDMGTPEDREFLEQLWQVKPGRGTMTSRSLSTSLRRVCTDLTLNGFRRLSGE